MAGGYADRCGPGPRQPLVVISPYAKKNFVDHTQTDQASILRFIEDNWHTGQIGDASADATAGSVNAMFNFHHQRNGQGPAQRADRRRRLHQPHERRRQLQEVTPVAVPLGAAIPRNATRPAAGYPTLEFGPAMPCEQTDTRTKRGVDAVKHAVATLIPAGEKVIRSLSKEDSHALEYLEPVFQFRAQ